MKKSTGALTLATVVLIGAGCLLLDRLVMKGRYHHSSSRSSMSQQSKLVDASTSEPATSKAEQDKKEATDEHLLIIELMLESLVGRSKRMEEKIKNLDTLLVKTKRLEEKLDRNNSLKKDVEKLKDKGKKRKQKKPQSSVTFGVLKPTTGFSEGPVAEISIDLMRITGDERKGHTAPSKVPKTSRRERREPWDHQPSYGQEKTSHYTPSNSYGAYSSVAHSNKSYGRKKERTDYGDDNNLEYQPYASSNATSYDTPPTFQLPSNELGSLPFGSIPFSAGLFNYGGSSSPSSPSSSQKTAPSSVASPKIAGDEESNSLFPAEDDLIKTTEFDTYEHLQQYNEAIEHGKTPDPVGVISSNVVRMGDLGIPGVGKSKKKSSSISSSYDPETMSFRTQAKDKTRYDDSTESKQNKNTDQGKIFLDQAPGLVDTAADATVQQQSRDSGQKGSYSVKGTGMLDQGLKTDDGSKSPGSTFERKQQDTKTDKPSHSGSLDILDQALGMGTTENARDRTAPSTPTVSYDETFKKPSNTKEGTSGPSGRDTGASDSPAKTGKGKEDSGAQSSYTDDSYTSNTKKNKSSVTNTKDKSVVQASIVQQKTTAPVVEIVTGSDTKSSKEEKDKLLEKIKQLETRLSAIEERKDKERDGVAATSGTKQSDSPIEIKALPSHSALSGLSTEDTRSKDGLLSEAPESPEALKDTDHPQKTSESGAADSLTEDSKKLSETELKQDEMLNSALINGLNDIDTDMGMGDHTDMGPN